MTEPLSLAFGAIWLASHFICAKRYGSGGAKEWAAWCGFALSLMAAYHIRPANLCLLPLSFVLGPILLAILQGPLLSLGFLLSYLRVLLITALVPFLLFCGLRKAIVNEFGLVTFAGSNLIGIAGLFLTGDSMPDLPENERPLAQEIVKNWRKYNVPSPLRGRYDIYRGGISELYNWMVETCVPPALAKFYGNNQVAADRALVDLSLSVILRRPILYLVWITKSVADILHSVLSSLAILIPLSLLAMMCLLRTTLQAFCPALPSSQSGFRETGFQALYLGAVFYFIFQVLLVVTMEAVLPRYTSHSMVFLPLIPAYLMMVAFEDCLAPARYLLHRAIDPTSSTIKNRLPG